MPSLAVLAALRVQHDGAAPTTETVGPVIGKASLVGRLLAGEVQRFPVDVADCRGAETQETLAALDRVELALSTVRVSGSRLSREGRAPTPSGESGGVPSSLWFMSTLSIPLSLLYAPRPSGMPDI